MNGEISLEESVRAMGVALRARNTEKVVAKQSTMSAVNAIIASVDEPGTLTYGAMVIDTYDGRRLAVNGFVVDLDYIDGLGLYDLKELRAVLRDVAMTLTSSLEINARSWTALIGGE